MTRDKNFQVKRMRLKMIKKNTHYHNKNQKTIWANNNYYIYDITSLIKKEKAKWEFTILIIAFINLLAFWK